MAAAPTAPKPFLQPGREIKQVPWTLRHPCGVQPPASVSVLRLQRVIVGRHHQAKGETIPELRGPSPACRSLSALWKWEGVVSGPSTRRHPSRLFSADGWCGGCGSIPSETGDPFSVGFRFREDALLAPPPFSLHLPASTLHPCSPQICS